MKTKQQQAYQQLANQSAPPRPVVRNVVCAFIVGGSICLIGQLFWSFLMSRGISPKQTAAMVSGFIALLGAVLTAIGVYDELGRFGGMGAALPVSGFANSIVSAALEFKREGMILGMASKMFVIAGPVIVYGLATAFIVSLIQYAIGAVVK
ncbi:MAG TPA: SpoVA/SpoVAEb family sporulation membrane protein [Firmicutes bacterium]|nr:SpoVA/SpoVAEb family sporulation membrane protein [Bacillota bacterium]